MEDILNLKNVAASLVYSIIGIGICVIGFFSFDKITPYHLWKEIIEEKNLALAIVVGAMTIGIALIISSAIHG